MRYGSYSEDSDESEGQGRKNSNNNGETKKLHSAPQMSIKQELDDAMQSNSESSFYSYHSDEENKDVELKQKKFGRKRSFISLDKSPDFKHLSQKSGLTQEINILSLYGDEHRMKRSNSLTNGQTV